MHPHPFLLLQVPLPARFAAQGHTMVHQVRNVRLIENQESVNAEKIIKEGS